MTASNTGRHPPAPRRGPGITRVLGRLSQVLVASVVLVGLVAALPWALWHYIGWPLPDHLLTGPEVQAVLLGPLTTLLLLDLLACLCWITWGAFVIDVVRCVVAAVRGLRWPQLDTRGPVHAVAAILVGVIMVALLGNRSPSATTAGTTEATSGHGEVVATATAASPPAVLGGPIRLVDTVRPAEAAGEDADSVVVRAPHNGTHDSLSRIAARTLGAAGRWPEIFALNRGKPQPHGGRFTNPNLIFPGQRLTLPTSASPPPRPTTGADRHAISPTAPVLPPPQPAPSPSAIPASPPRPGPPPTAPRATAVPAVVPAVVPAPRTGVTPGSGPGIGWEPGGFVGLGLAAAISTTLVAARRRSRRRYRPDSGRRDDLPVAPVVYQLRLAHLRAEHADDCAPDDLDDGERNRCDAAPALVIGDTPDAHTPVDRAEGRRVTPGLGMRDGREIALDLAVAHGLGLVGAGACAAARALLLTLLTQPPVPAAAQVLITVEDLALVLGPEQAHHQCPAAVRVVADLDAALDELEAEMLRRVRENNSAAGAAWPVLALVARPPEENTQRLQAVLDNGAPFGLVGVLLGQWRPGLSAYIRDDGTVSSASPGPGQALVGTRMFRLPEAETAQLLTLLRQAEPDTPDAAPPASDPAAPLAPVVRHREGSPCASAQSPARSAPLLALDARDGSNDVMETALEVTVIPHAEHEGVSPGPPPALRPRAASEPPPRQVDAEGRQSHHGHDGQRAEQSAAAVRCCSVATADRSDASLAPITLTVLGRLQVHWTPDPTSATGEGGAGVDGAVREIAAVFPPRQRELLVFLALHPDGVHRDVLVAGLWQGNAPQRPTNALNTALSRLRRSVTQATGGAISDLIVIGDNRYHLDPCLVAVDYWRLRDAVTARRAAGSDRERLAAYQQIVDCYRGCLAEGLDTEWIDAPREATRRDALDAVAALARALVDADPQKTLDLLETARVFDPHNELLYRDIMRLQQRLGHLDAIPRTLTLLITRLAEIDETPTPQALALAAGLQQRHDTEHADPRAPGPARTPG
ncbi:MAG: BTAD domain-containing putative transcriptional regulator [Pseudonocardiaceae bacterium]